MEKARKVEKAVDLSYFGPEDHLTELIQTKREEIEKESILESASLIFEYLVATGDVSPRDKEKTLTRISKFTSVLKISHEFFDPILNGYWPGMFLVLLAHWHDREPSVYPTKTTRITFQHAIKVAAMFISTKNGYSRDFIQHRLQNKPNIDPTKRSFSPFNKENPYIQSSQEDLNFALANVDTEATENLINNLKSGLFPWFTSLPENIRKTFFEDFELYVLKITGNQLRNNDSTKGYSAFVNGNKLFVPIDYTLDLLQHEISHLIFPNVYFEPLCVLGRIINEVITELNAGNQDKAYIPECRLLRPLLTTPTMENARNELLLNETSHPDIIYLALLAQEGFERMFAMLRIIFDRSNLFAHADSFFLTTEQAWEIINNTRPPNRNLEVYQNLLFPDLSNQQSLISQLHTQQKAHSMKIERLNQIATDGQLVLIELENLNKNLKLTSQNLNIADRKNLFDQCEYILQIASSNPEIVPHLDDAFPSWRDLIEKTIEKIRESLFLPY